jgi:hypothetical protein
MRVEKAGGRERAGTRQTAERRDGHFPSRARNDDPVLLRRTLLTLLRVQAVQPDLFGSILHESFTNFDIPEDRIRFVFD